MPSIHHIAPETQYPKGNRTTQTAPIESSGAIAHRRLDAALELAAAGYHIIPLHLKGDNAKKPIVKWGTEGCNAPELPASEAMIRNWWGRWPDANIAVATGPIPGFFVVDIDDFNSPLALEWVPKLPPTRQVLTSRGAHYYFKHPAGVKISSHDIGTVVNADKSKAYIDIKGWHSYVVAPGSLHASGRVYQANELPIADAPQWLLDIVVDKPRAPRPEKQNTPIDYGTDKTAEIQAALAALGSFRMDTYETWLHVGMSLYELGNEGLSLWSNWSEWKPGECAEKWKSFGRDDGYSVKSIFKWAYEDDPSWFARFRETQPRKPYTKQTQAPAPIICEKRPAAWPAPVSAIEAWGGRIPGAWMTAFTANKKSLTPLMCTIVDLIASGHLIEPFDKKSLTRALRSVGRIATSDSLPKYLSNGFDCAVEMGIFLKTSPIEGYEYYGDVLGKMAVYQLASIDAMIIAVMDELRVWCDELFASRTRQFQFGDHWVDVCAGASLDLLNDVNAQIVQGVKALPKQLDGHRAARLVDTEKVFETLLDELRSGGGVSIPLDDSYAWDDSDSFYEAWYRGIVRFFSAQNRGVSTLQAAKIMGYRDVSIKGLRKRAGTERCNQFIEVPIDLSRPLGNQIATQAEKATGRAKRVDVELASGFTESYTMRELSQIQTLNPSAVKVATLQIQVASKEWIAVATREEVQARRMVAQAKESSCDAHSQAQPRAASVAPIPRREKLFRVQLCRLLDLRGDLPGLYTGQGDQVEIEAFKLASTYNLARVVARWITRECDIESPDFSIDTDDLISFKSDTVSHSETPDDAAFEAWLQANPASVIRIPARVTQPTQPARPVWPAHVPDTELMRNLAAAGREYVHSY